MTVSRPLSGLVLLSNMMLDEVIVGGPGSGLFGMLLFAIVAVFIAGLMIGRTPEYLGKKIEANEVKMTMLALLWVPACILGLTATAAILPGSRREPGQYRPARFHGITLSLYLRRGDQWQRLRRAECQLPLLQSDLGGGDVRGTLRGDRAGAVHCRPVGGQAHRPRFRWERCRRMDRCSSAC